jgi:hypothetical protein
MIAMFEGGIAMGGRIAIDDFDGNGAGGNSNQTASQPQIALAAIVNFTRRRLLRVILI